MDEYRPQMRKLYYNPAMYDTYLNQLGISYPDEQGGTPALRNGK
jgi:aminobenzoyl-glutamate utilization protein B